MKDCIIFGCGFYGKNAYIKLSRYYNVKYYADNNSDVIGTQLYGIEVIGGSDVLKVNKRNAMDIFICTRAYMDIYRKLRKLGITNCFAMVEGFLYQISEDEVLYPYSLEKPEYFHKTSNEKNILFVQNSPCIRTQKIARVMKQRGYKTYLLYSMTSLNAGNDNKTFEKDFMVFTPEEVIDFVDNSEFDIVHSSNEPDLLTNLLVQTNKKIVFDTHDMMSLCQYTDIEYYILETIANVCSDGVIYTSQGVSEIANKKYCLKDKPVLILDNCIDEELLQHKFKDKLSNTDGGIHCVYEGGINGSDPDYPKYLEKIFISIADSGVHLHFYSPADENYCKKLADKSQYLHYEGNMSSNVLATEMTQYDCGIAIFNIKDKYRSFIETASANKIYEYWNAGIPVATGGVKAFAELVQKYSGGIELDMNSDIKKQLIEASKIRIDDDFIQKNGFTMNSKGADIETFYEMVKMS